MSCPDERMWGAALRVLHYLSVHRHLGLRYMRSDSTPTHGFSDSDWAVKHSTTGFTFQYANATISWGSKKQTSVVLSSCEAEIMAASEAAKEAVYLREFLNELGSDYGRTTEDVWWDEDTTLKGRHPSISFPSTR